jgi:hypothetical protein
METEEATALEAVTRRRPARIQQTENLVRAVVNYRVFELPLALLLFVVPFCKSSINKISNPNPACSHSYTCLFPQCIPDESIYIFTST